MKKFYSLLMVAGVSTLACSAIQPQMATASESFVPSISAKSLAVKDINISNNAESTVVKRVSPVKASAQHPATLTEKSYAINFNINEDTAIPATSAVTFTQKAVDGEYIIYSMSGWAENYYSSLEFSPIDVYYNTTDGSITIPMGQDFVKVPYQGVVNQATLWNKGQGNQLYGGIPLIFEFDGDGFEWVRTNTFNFSDGTQETITSYGVFIGWLTASNQVSGAMDFDNLYFSRVQGTMTFTANLLVSGVETPTEMGGPLFVDFDGTYLNIEGFGNPVVNEAVPFVVDTKAKTITCTDVQIGQTNGTPIFLSEADKDMFNVYESEQTYKLVCSYTVANGVTTFQVPDWNGFYYESATKEDVNAYVRIYDCKMFLDLDLDALVSGIGDIAVDAADENAPVEYFNLQGVRVQNPENGLYIRRQGKNVTKVIL
ncbi:MAG: hypothetical protein K2G24_09755 [Muribaculaceae bacterium]|nr:hypothetical protein [Muribaculaceae bacterium]